MKSIECEPFKTKYKDAIIYRGSIYICPMSYQNVKYYNCLNYKKKDDKKCSGQIKQYMEKQKFFLIRDHSANCSNNYKKVNTQSNSSGNNSDNNDVIEEGEHSNLTSQQTVNKTQTQKQKPKVSTKNQSSENNNEKYNKTEENAKENEKDSKTFNCFNYDFEIERLLKANPQRTSKEIFNHFLNDNKYKNIPSYDHVRYI